MTDQKPRRLRGHKATATCCVASVDTPGLVATADEVLCFCRKSFEIKLLITRCLLGYVWWTTWVKFWCCFCSCLYVGWLCLLVRYAMQRSGRYYGGGNGRCFFVMLQARLKAKTFMCWSESLTKLQSEVWKFIVVGWIREWKYGICIIGEGSEELWCASGTWTNLISLCLFWCVCDCCLLNFGVCLFPFLKGTSCSWKVLESYDYNKEEINQVPGFGQTLLLFTLLSLALLIFMSLSEWMILYDCLVDCMQL